MCEAHVLAAWLALKGQAPCSMCITLCTRSGQLSGSRIVLLAKCEHCCLPELRLQGTPVWRPQPVSSLAAAGRRPLLHALVNPGVAGGWGMEVDRVKCDKAAAFLAQAAAALLRRGTVAQALAVPHVRCAPVEQARRPLWRGNLQSLVGGASGLAPLPGEGSAARPLNARPCRASHSPFLLAQNLLCAHRLLRNGNQSN